MKKERVYKHKAFFKLKDSSLPFHLLFTSLNTTKYSGIIPCVDMELSLFKNILGTLESKSFGVVPGIIRKKFLVLSFKMSFVFNFG